jgi:hypothetical protein
MKKKNFHSLLIILHYIRLRGGGHPDRDHPPPTVVPTVAPPIKKSSGAASVLKKISQAASEIYYTNSNLNPRFTACLPFGKTRCFSHNEYASLS